MPQLAIVTVGGTLNAIETFLRETEPDRVVFVHSPESEETARKAAATLSPAVWDLCRIEDPDDLASCVRTLRRLDEEVDRWRRKGPDCQVVVDITGGTKAMVAAATLVARNWRCDFSYIGGAQRTKNGLGIVVTGTEKQVLRSNPWGALGYQAVEDACLLFDQHAFDAAAALLEDARNAASDQETKRRLNTLKTLCEAYSLWDRFSHEKAFNRLKKASQNAADLDAALGVEQAGPLRMVFEGHLQLLEALGPKQPSRTIIVDLLSNARRRGEEKRWEDGVARLYRALEAMAQWRLASDYGLASTKQVPQDQLPDTLRQKWAKRVNDQGTLSLGVRASYELLGALGDPLGRQFEEAGLHRGDSALESRNNSILAHGFESATKRTFDALWKIVLDLGVIRDDELTEFPRLSRTGRDTSSARRPPGT